LINLELEGGIYLFSQFICVLQAAKLQNIWMEKQH